MNKIKKIGLVVLGLAVIGTSFPAQAKAGGCEFWNIGCMWYFIATGTYYTPYTPNALQQAQKATN